MARLMSLVKGGYYAAAPEAVAAVLERLRPPSTGICSILDPCAGEGHALLQLESSRPQERVFPLFRWDYQVPRNSSITGNVSLDCPLDCPGLLSLDCLIPVRGSGRRVSAPGSVFSRRGVALAVFDCVSARLVARGGAILTGIRNCVTWPAWV
jgi:hypothetical protein